MPSPWLVSVSLPLLFACGGERTAAPPPASTPSHAAAPLDDGMVDIGGGASLHLHCVGRGTPTVVLENGHGADGTSWKLVLDDLGRITRACAYDRWGDGYSSGPAPKHHSFRQMAHELQAMLERAAIRGPYVLVAHSVGGINVRLFQAEHPDEVVGMVLVDAETEDSLQGLIGVLSSPGTPDDLRTTIHDDLGPWAEDLRTSARPLGDMPLVVLSSGEQKEPLPPPFKPEQEIALRQKEIAGHERVAHLSTNSAHAIADHSQHFIQIDAPRLVVASVKQVVEAVRTHGRVDAKALEPFLHEGPLQPRD